MMFRFCLAGLALVLMSARATAANIDLFNQSNLNIVALYVSDVRKNDWGPDQLGPKSQVPPNTHYTLVDIDPGEYDMKFITDDGRSCIARDIQLDDTTNMSWTVSDELVKICAGK